MDSNEEFSYAMQLVTSISLTMVLKSAMKLRVLEAIAEAGPNARLSAHEVAYGLSMPNQDAPDMLDRMLRLLSTYSIVSCTQRDGEMKPVRVYGLAPVAKYLIRNEDGASLGALMELTLDKMLIDGWLKLDDSVVEGGVPFEKVYGKKAFEYSESDQRFNEVFNNAMVNHSTLVIKEILKCYHSFDNVVGIKHVGGDMFLDVPQGDAIFVKWILHDWSDEHCVKLLKNCYKALLDDGKVIVVDAIISSSSDISAFAKAIAHVDAIMMTHYPGGKERTEDEILALAKGAEFTEMKKKCQVCNVWVMELYK